MIIELVRDLPPNGAKPSTCVMVLAVIRKKNMVDSTNMKGYRSVDLILASASNLYETLCSNVKHCATKCKIHRRGRTGRKGKENLMGDFNSSGEGAWMP